MGNSESNTVKSQNGNIPIRPVLNRPSVVAPVYGYNNYPGPYMPQQYVYPGYPANYPVVSNETYLPNEFYPQLQAKHEVLEQHNPAYHHNHARHSHRHHHHHHHRPTPSPEKERLSPPIPKERETSLGPTPYPPNVHAQKPVSSVLTHKLTSPVANRDRLTPSPPPVHHSHSLMVKNSSTPMLHEKHSSSILMKQHQSPQPYIPKGLSPSRSAASNSFERAPIIGTNYVAKPSDSHSIHNYGPGTMSVVRRSSSKFTAPGNRWYDHDYDKRVKSLTVIDV